MAVIDWKIGNRKESLEYAKIALGLDPENERIKRNIENMEKAIEKQENGNG